MVAEMRTSTVHLPIEPFTLALPGHCPPAAAAELRRAGDLRERAPAALARGAGTAPDLGRERLSRLDPHRRDEEQIGELRLVLLRHLAHDGRLPRQAQDHVRL